MNVLIFKNYYIEKFEDFQKLGKLIIVESNIVLGFAEILDI